MPQSLPARLALLFSILVTVALTSMGAYAYHAINGQLEARDQEIVRGKLAQMEHLIRELPTLEEVPESVHRIDDIVRGHDGLAIWVRSERGRILYRTRDALPSDLDLDSEPHAAQISTPLVTDRRVVAIGDSASLAIVTIAQTGGERAAVVSRFRTSLLAGTTVGVVLTAMLGAAITRRELLPAQRLVRQVNRISVERLSYRVDVPTRPAEVKEISAAFNDMLGRLETGYERLYRFSADLAHDMRTPLNNLIGHAEITLSRDRTTAEYALVMEESLLEYQRLSRMIDGMLFLARADTANIRLDTVSIDLADELEKLSNYFAILAAESSVVISIDCGGRLRADPMLFRRAINNLLANAIEHADPNSTVAVRTKHDKDDVVIQIANQGRPVSEKDISNIFERFYRVDRARANSDRSTGLGLAIVRSIMDLHGGAATARSLPGGVTQFELRFPRS